MFMLKTNIKAITFYPISAALPANFANPKFLANS